MSPVVHAPLRPLRWLPLLAVLLGGCGGADSAGGLLEDYLYRVGNASGMGEPPADPPALAVYPSPRERTLPLTELRIGFIKFFQLHDCELFSVISERNSILGRVMPISRQLDYELRFLQSAAACRARLAAAPAPDPELLAELDNAIAVKADNLARVFWNATLASPEMQKTFSLAVRPLAPGEETPFVNSLQALNYFNDVGRRLGEPDLRLSLEELEAQYYTLQLQQYGGRLLHSLALLGDTLERAAAALEAALDERPVCFRNQPSERGRILHTVFVKYYAGQVQPYLSQIHRQGEAWLTALERLIAVQTVEPPPAFAAYRARMLAMDTEEGLWRRFRDATRRHTEAWQAVLRQCGLLPQRPG